MAQSLSTASSSQAPITKSDPKPIQDVDRRLRPLSPADQSQFASSFRNGHLNLNTFSPVNEHGSFEFDRVLKRGKVLCKIKSRHAFKASWKTGYLVLRPNLLSVYKDEDEARLLLSLTLTEVTAVAPVNSSRPGRNYTWGVFTPSKNYRFQSVSDKDAEVWIERIRSELHVDEEEEAIVAESKSKAGNVPVPVPVLSDVDDHLGITASELSDVGETEQGTMSSSPELSKTLSLGPRGKNLPFTQDYSGNDMTEYSDLSDAPDSNARAQQQQRSGRLSCPKGGEIASASSATNPGDPQKRGFSTRETPLGDPERVVFQGYLQCLRSKRGVRQWKRLWVVLRPISLALYKDDKEYCAVRIIPMSQVINAAEIDPISRSKNFCLQIITEDRPTYRFCAPDEESLAKWLGALKSIIVARNKAIEKEKAGISSVTTPMPTIVAPPPEPFQPLR